MCLVIRFYLNRENSVRAKALEEINDQSDEALEMGEEILQVGKDDLDLTDRQNLKFVYPL